MTLPTSIIFDLDGTLLDTLRDIADTANAVLREHDLPTHPLKSYSVFVGDGLNVLMQRTLPTKHSPQLVEECCRRFLEMYQDHWDRHCRPYDGIVEMLASFSGAGIPMAILSNKPHEFTVRFADRFFANYRFSLIYGQRPGVPKKPDPTVALDIAKRLRCNPREMLFVGDTPIDIRTGKAASMPTVAVTWGFRSIRELSPEFPDLLINHPKELEKYVLASN